MSETPEVWLRGPVAGVDAWLQPVVHALLQVREELEALAARVPAEHVWQSPGGAASVGFHVRHLGGALDRLFTYARGEQLTDEQKAFARREAEPGSPLATVVAETSAVIDRAIAQVRATSAADLLATREVGRAKLPSTTLGLLFHGAEHSTRHAGQAISTARLLAAG